MEHSQKKIKEEISPSKIRKLNINKISVPRLNKEKILKSIKENPLRQIDIKNITHSIKRDSSKNNINKKKENGVPNSLINNLSYNANNQNNISMNKNNSYVR